MIMPPPPAGLGDGVKGRHEGAESSNNNWVENKLKDQSARKTLIPILS